MYKNKQVAVVVPAYNEESLISRVITTMPDFVDKIYIIDDASTDETAAVVKSFCEGKSFSEKLSLIQHHKNQGVGASIVTGYKKAYEEKMDIVAVMAGDAQMDPDDMPQLLNPIIDGKADYTKGNRLVTGEAWNQIPHYRYLGNAFLSLMTKIASGFWQVADSQTGYTAISREALAKLPLDSLYKRYGYPNHMLVMLNVNNLRVIDIPVRPVYNIGEKSGIKLFSVIPKITWLLISLFFWRMKEKYIIRDFHPLIFFYILAFTLFLASMAFCVRLIMLWIRDGFAPPMTSLALVFCIVTGLQSMFFAMWFDMENNKNQR